jgi:hypothetical protein
MYWSLLLPPKNVISDAGPGPVLAGFGAEGGGVLPGRRDPGARVRQQPATRRGRAQYQVQRYAQRPDEGVLPEVRLSYDPQLIFFGTSTERC